MNDINKKHIESIKEDNDSFTIKFHKNPKDTYEEEEKSDSAVIEEPIVVNFKVWITLFSS